MVNGIIPYHQAYLQNKMYKLFFNSSLVDRVNLEHLDLICEALNCNLDELIVRVPDESPKIVHTKSGSLTSSSDR